MAERLIKKYPNRRLYDTELSKYITVADIRNLVMAGIRFRVVDSNSDEDLTRTVLLQIITEEEMGGKPLFSADMLAQLIRLYGGTMQGMFSQYLEETFRLFNNQSEEFTKQIGAQNPFEMMEKAAQQNYKMWSDWQNSLWGGGSNDKK